MTSADPVFDLLGQTSHNLQNSNYLSNIACSPCSSRLQEIPLLHRYNKRRPFIADMLKPNVLLTVAAISLAFVLPVASQDVNLVRGREGGNLAAKSATAHTWIWGVQAPMLATVVVNSGEKNAWLCVLLWRRELNCNTTYFSLVHLQ